MATTPPTSRRVPLLALLLGVAAAVACWVRLGTGEESILLEVTLRETARTADRVVYTAEITTDVIPEITTIHPSGDWVRWDPEDTGVENGRRRIVGKVTVGKQAAAGGEKPGFWIRVAGRPVRFVEVRP